VRGAAVWALWRLEGEDAFAERAARADKEVDRDVRAEWDACLAGRRG
jgi:hypothetical protein